jgi:hypothetical protein
MHIQHVLHLVSDCTAPLKHALSTQVSNYFNLHRPSETCAFDSAFNWFQLAPPHLGRGCWRCRHRGVPAQVKLKAKHLNMKAIYHISFASDKFHTLSSWV